ncbi:dockerin type I repeat-containing protein [Ruminococcus sp.]|uniref:dockerin type I repeat-containing protein n=1 Tax=Ruminococcus sp. TaxID=41978 RepID=UPI0025E5C0A5|nr:dockerin type I repeat-containing protein [Ruminococcus sp.]
MKKKVLAAITATMCCMGAISVPGIAIASATEPVQSYDTQINYIDSFKTIVETYMNDNNISGKIYTEGFKESEKILIEVMSDSDAQLVKSFIETEGKGAFYIDFTPLGPDRGIRILAGEEGLENVRGNVSQFMEENNIIGYTYYKSTNTNIITVVCNSNEDIEHIKAYVAEKCYRAERLEYELPDFEVNPPEIAPTNLEEMRLILDDFIKQNGMNGYTTIRPRKGEDKVWIILDTGKDEYYRKIELFMTLYGIDSDNVIISVETTNASTNESTVKGDTNCDGSVDMSDAVLIMQALANPNKYGIDGTAEHHLTEQGKLNADMNGDGLTVGDAQAIQMKLLGLEVSDSRGNDNQYLISIQYETFSRDYPYYNTISDLANKANQVFSGTVKNISFEILDIRTMQPIKDGEDIQWATLCTIYEIEAEEVYAGTPTSVKLRIEGGIPSGFEQEQIALLGNGKIPVMEDAPVLTIGEKYLFALYHAENAEYSSILNPLQSVYTENEVKEGGFSAAEIIAYFQ